MVLLEDVRRTYAPLEAVRISDHVYWIGAIDWEIRNFHGYATQRGTTYNAFLVLADKITLIDTVKAPFKDELLARVASIIDPSHIDYIISNHAEMDHTGCLPEIIDAVQPERVFASPLGVKALSDHFHLDQEITPVKDGERLDLGGLTLSFLETRMLHWPDSMFTFLAEDGVLFSNDAFGMHLASSTRFADEVHDDVLLDEGAKYFANILLPYSSLVTKLLDKVGAMNLPIATIAPDHGPIWRNELTTVLNRYADWAAQKRTNKAVVVFDTMWQSTAKMARAIAEGLMAGGAPVQMMPLNACHRSDVATELLDAGALLVGSPTLNNNIFPPVADVLTYLKGLRPRGLVAAAFGSYGWGGEAVGQVQDILTAMDAEVVGNLKVKFVPDHAALAQCRALGAAVAERLQAKLKEEKS